MGFVNQTWQRISLIVDFTLTDAASAKIKFVKPSGAESEWAAVIAEPRTLQKLYYDLTIANEVNEEGEWKFWGWATKANGEVIFGDPVYHTFKAEGT